MGNLRSNAFSFSFAWFIAVMGCMFMGSNPVAQESLKVISYNIRYDEKNDGEDRWEKRKEAVLQQLHGEKPDFFGIQEGLIHQVRDLKKGLKHYARIGVGRDDGKEAGEFSALFFDSTRWTLISAETFWLSETPGVPSFGWDANCRRVVTWGTFRNKIGDTIAVMNTHLDHLGVEARRNSIRLIKDRIEAMGGARVILTGDFNFTPDDPNYSVITTFLEDARQSADLVREVYPGTYNGFLKTGDFDRRIDYVFYSPGGFRANSYEVPDWRRKGNGQVSDHFPVIVEFTILEP